MRSFTVATTPTTPTVAAAITNKGGTNILVLKRNKPTLHDEVATSFANPATTGLGRIKTTNEDHGRIESRTTTVSHDVTWMAGSTATPASTASCPGVPDQGHDAGRAP